MDYDRIKTDKEFEKELITSCLKGNSLAQTKLYNIFAPKMKVVCAKLAKNDADIPDLLQEGFIKVFSYLKSFRFEGSFEGWIKRIMVNSALNFYKKKQIPTKEIEVEQACIDRTERNAGIHNLSLNELMILVHTLPEGYKKVFTLSMIEGYSHKEIGQQLNISVNTSKSQLTRARVNLRNKLSVNYYPNQNIENNYYQLFAS